MERRNHQRANFNVSAYIEHNDLSYSVKVVNISLNGMLLETKEIIDIEINSVLKVKLSVTEHSPEVEIFLEGIVIRKEGCFIGVQIDNIDLDSFINLRDIVANNSDDYEKIMKEFYIDLIK